MANKSISNRASSDATVFKPGEAVQEIRKFESAEKHFLKAKDSEQLKIAVAEKMRLQREFVVWWDSQERRGQPKKGDSTVTLNDYGSYKEEVYKWRQRLKDEAKYEKALEQAQEKAIRACEGKGSPFAELHGNKNNDWYTPKQYIDAAKAVMGDIDTDPATSEKAQETVMASVYYTAKDDGLEHDWSGRVWINPPFSNVQPFADKLINHLESGDVTQAIVLTNNNTDTQWFHKMAAAASCVCFTMGRISFYDEFGETSAPTNGQCFFYFGTRPKTFAKQFASFGGCFYHD